MNKKTGMDEAQGSKQNPEFETVRDEVAEEFEREYGPITPVAPEMTMLSNLEDEVGLEEVSVDPAELDTVVANNTDDNLDTNDDGIVDQTPGRISNRPPELTQTYGTGLEGQPTDRTGHYSRRDPHLHSEADYTLTGNDVDANYEDAETVGEEAVGGEAPTPDQDIVEDLAAAVGIQTDDRSFLRTNDMLEERDNHRWELDPMSAEGYRDRHPRSAKGSNDPQT